jgi:hypothetical protein
MTVFVSKSKKRLNNVNYKHSVGFFSQQLSSVRSDQIHYRLVISSTRVNKPDNRDLLVKTYGNQGITGFLQMVGAVKSNGAADSSPVLGGDSLASTSGCYSRLLQLLPLQLQ